MRMAEHRAAVNALHSIYTVRGDNLDLALEEISAGGADATSSASAPKWTLPTSLHADYPLGASLGAQAADGPISGTGIHAREVEFEGRIGRGRSEVLIESGRKWRAWRGSKGVADERVAA